LAEGLCADEALRGSNCTPRFQHSPWQALRLSSPHTWICKMLRVTTGIPDQLHFLLVGSKIEKTQRRRRRAASNRRAAPVRIVRITRY